jgi:predicted transposase/invertase (TIGR01784 family)
MHKQNENDILVPDILPPTDDGVFKTLMLKSERIRASLISGFIGVDVVSVTVINNEPPSFADGKNQERFDVNCVTSDGQQIELELQSNPMQGDSYKNAHRNITARSVFNLCDLFARQQGEGVRYRDLKRTFQIMICDYTVFPKRQNFINLVQMRFEDGEVLNDYINSVFIVLSILDELLKKPIDELSNSDCWALFLEYADKPKHQNVINAIAKQKEDIMEAVGILISISKDDYERAKFRERRKARMEAQHNLLASFMEGEEKGEKQKAFNIARKALRKGYSIEDIIELTELTAEQITALSNSQP